MNTDFFWTTLETARAAAPGDVDELLFQLSDALDGLPDDDLVQFQHQMMREYWRCFRHDLRAALFILAGAEGFTEEFIDGFGGWLLAQGRETFEKVLANPDSLAALDLLPEDVQAGDLLDLPGEVYADRTDGGELPDDPAFTPPAEPEGAALEEKDLPAKFPQLCDRYEYEVPLPG
jgi:hypothetical protein